MASEKSDAHKQEAQIKSADMSEEMQQEAIEVGQALKLENNTFRTGSRLGVRTAKAISRELERRYLELAKRYEAIMPAIDARIEFKKKLEVHKIQQHRKHMDEELKRKIKFQALKNLASPGYISNPE
ncbi:Dynein light chain type 1 [Pyrenophora tritici-repentis]|nr:Dynein light chain type 1 [Pyrenophora tritici-repentis]